MTDNVHDVLLKFFKDEKWPAEESAELRVLRAGYQGKNGKAVCYAKWNEDDNLVTFYAVPQLPVSREKISALMEFITRANFGLPVGNFEVDLEDGELRFKAGIDVEGSQLDVPMVRQLVYSSLVTLDRYLPGLEGVLEHNESPKDAVSRVEGLKN